MGNESRQSSLGHPPWECSLNPTEQGQEQRRAAQVLKDQRARTCCSSIAEPSYPGPSEGPGELCPHHIPFTGHYSCSSPNITDTSQGKPLTTVRGLEVWQRQQQAFWERPCFSNTARGEAYTNPQVALQSRHQKAHPNADLHTYFFLVLPLSVSQASIAWLLLGPAPI